MFLQLSYSLKIIISIFATAHFLTPPINYRGPRSSYISKHPEMTTEFENIIVALQEPLYWHIRRLVVGHEDARDILQDTFVKAYSKVGQLKDAKAFKAWVYKIATNEALEFIRKRNRRATDEQITEALTAKLMASEWVDYKNDGLIRFQKALLRLSPAQRAVFTLRYYDELDYEDISRITGSSPGSAKVIYHNAKEKVKEYILNR